MGEFLPPPTKTYPFYTWKGKEDMGIPIFFLLISTLCLSKTNWRKENFTCFLQNPNFQFFCPFLLSNFFSVAIKSLEFPKFLSKRNHGVPLTSGKAQPCYWIKVGESRSYSWDKGVPKKGSYNLNIILLHVLSGDMSLLCKTFQC